jgi:hypothetical protein
MKRFTFMDSAVARCSAGVLNRLTSGQGFLHYTFNAFPENLPELMVPAGFLIRCYFAFKSHCKTRLLIFLF